MIGAALLALSFNISAQQLEPRDHAPAYELGLLRQAQGRAEDALAAFDRAAKARPDFFAAHFSAGLLPCTRLAASSASSHSARLSTSGMIRYPKHSKMKRSISVMGPGWATQKTFRLGASSLFAALVQAREF